MTKAPNFCDEGIYKLQKLQFFATKEYTNGNCFYFFSACILFMSKDKTQYFFTFAEQLLINIKQIWPSSFRSIINI